ncbi:hypothetical protein K1719_040798 [Acacia pycnantha]|nr:hypothetical protein K1719_040798 [Acacia pycnantha]
MPPKKRLEFHSYKLSGDSRWSSEFMSSRSSPEVHGSSANATLTKTYGDNLLNPTTSHMDDNMLHGHVCKENISVDMEQEENIEKVKKIPNF